MTNRRQTHHDHELRVLRKLQLERRRRVRPIERHVRDLPCLDEVRERGRPSGDDECAVRRRARAGDVELEVLALARGVLDVERVRRRERGVRDGGGQQGPGARPGAGGP